MKWAVLKITDGDITVHKLLRGMYGGYLYGDSWALNSGIKHVRVEEEHYVVEGFSGSQYVCPKECEGISVIMAAAIQDFKEKADVEVVKMEDYLDS